MREKRKRETEEEEDEGRGKGRSEGAARGGAEGGDERGDARALLRDLAVLLLLLHDVHRRVRPDRREDLPAQHTVLSRMSVEGWTGGREKDWRERRVREARTSPKWPEPAQKSTATPPSGSRGIVHESLGTSAPHWSGKGRMRQIRLPEGQAREPRR